jgi:hypothetical protein
VFFAARRGPVVRGLLLDPSAGVPVGGEDESGGGVGAAALNGREHAGVGICGDHDAGVPEQILNGLQIRAGLMRQGGGAVPKVVQPDRGQVGAGGEDPEPGGGVVRVDRGAGLAVNT